MKFEVARLVTLAALLAAATSIACAGSALEQTSESAGAAGSAGSAGSAGAAGDATGYPCIADVSGTFEQDQCKIWGGALTSCNSVRGNWALQLCSSFQLVARPSVLAAFNACAGGVLDLCDQKAVSACATGLLGKGCAQPRSADNCAAIESSCPGVTHCADVLDLTTAQGQLAIAECMNPNHAGHVSIGGGCNNQLLYCAGLPYTTNVPTP